MNRKSSSRVAGLIAISLALAFALPQGALAQWLFTKGDHWVYDLSSTFGNATAIGSLNISYAGMTTISLSGQAYDVYDLKYDSYFTWSGSMSGMSTVVEHMYVDVNSQDLVVDEYNQTDSLTITSGGSPQSYYAWTYNKTAYTPPGGSGNWPSSLYKGETWTITYTMTYEEMSYDGSSFTSTSGTLIDITTYNVIDRESVIVPAGTFDCVVIRESTADTIFTRWYSDRVGNDVKVISEAGPGENTTMVLRSYSYSGSGPGQASILYVLLGVAMAAAVVVVVALIYSKRKLRPPTSVPSTNLLEQPPKGPYY